MSYITITQKIKQAAAFVKDGRLVAFPSGTSYGLAADTQQGWALQRLRNLKNRPAEKTFTVFMKEELWDQFLLLTDPERQLLKKNDEPTVDPSGSAGAGSRSLLPSTVLARLGSGAPAPRADDNVHMVTLSREIGVVSSILLQGARRAVTWRADRGNCTIFLTRSVRDTTRAGEYWRYCLNFNEIKHDADVQWSLHQPTIFRLAQLMTKLINDVHCCPIHVYSSSIGFRYNLSGNRSNLVPCAQQLIAMLQRMDQDYALLNSIICSPGNSPA